MALTSWPYISILTDPEDPDSGDRKIGAGEQAQGIELMVVSGIIKDVDNELAVTKVADSLTVSIATGAAIIVGHPVINDAAITAELNAGGAQPRIDIVVLESNETTAVRTTRQLIVEGTPAETPEAPELTNSGGIYQFPLMQYLIPAGATNLNNASEIDLREYIAGRHTHSIEDVEGLMDALSNKAAASHTHDSRYYTESEVDNSLAGKSDTGHTHDSRYYTESEVNNLLAGKAAASHTHDSRYYTESEIINLLAGKSDTGHTHDSRYYTESEVNNLLNAKINGPVSSGDIKFSASQPSLAVGDIWLKDLGLV